MYMYKNKYLKYKNKYLNYIEEIRRTYKQTEEYKKFIDNLEIEYYNKFKTFIENLSIQGYTNGILILKSSIFMYKPWFNNCNKLNTCEDLLLKITSNEDMNGLLYDIKELNEKECFLYRISWEINKLHYTDNQVSEYLEKQYQIAIHKSILNAINKIDYNSNCNNIIYLGSIDKHSTGIILLSSPSDNI